MQKNNKISDRLREKGNQDFARRDFFGALTFYNQALCFAELNTSQVGLCYGNRSAAFFQVKQYKSCLQNIRWARSSNIPKEKLSKLEHREIYCWEQMITLSPDEDTWNSFFKLSYDPNPKIPFLANCLELKPRVPGRFLTTTEDLEPGDIIGIVDPFFRLPMETSYYRCNYCVTDKFMNLIPCTGCSAVMFCDKACMAKAFKEFHQFECGIADNPLIPKHCYAPLRMAMKCVSVFEGSSKKLEHLVEDNGPVYTPFDFDWSDSSSAKRGEEMLLTQICPNQHFEQNEGVSEESLKDVQDFIDWHPKLRNKITEKLFDKLVQVAQGDRLFFKTVDAKSMTKIFDDLPPFKMNYFGSAIDLCYNLFWYSCAPNIYLHPYNGKIVWIVLQPMKAGEFLTIAHSDQMFFKRTLEQRIERNPHVVESCRCPACVNKWDVLNTVAFTQIKLLKRTSEEAIDAHEQYGVCIAKEFKPRSRKCQENLWFFVSQIIWNLYAIGRASFWAAFEEQHPNDFEAKLTVQDENGKDIDIGYKFDEQGNWVALCKEHGSERNILT